MASCLDGFSYACRQILSVIGGRRAPADGTRRNCGGGGESWEEPKSRARVRGVHKHADVRGERNRPLVLSVTRTACTTRAAHTSVHRLEGVHVHVHINNSVRQSVSSGCRLPDLLLVRDWSVHAAAGEGGATSPLSA